MQPRGIEAAAQIVKPRLRDRFPLGHFLARRAHRCLGIAPGQRHGLRKRIVDRVMRGHAGLVHRHHSRRRFGNGLHCCSFGGRGDCDIGRRRARVGFGERRQFGCRRRRRHVDRRWHGHGAGGVDRFGGQRLAAGVRNARARQTRTQQHGGSCLPRRAPRCA
ncbi:hypothetical protein F7R19_29375 [Cupriavidus pauculus]|nr:hypothetical protein F7R19_29375 [Cupriavidus pauculus]